MTLSGTEWILTGLDLDDGQFFSFATILTDLVKPSVTINQATGQADPTLSMTGILFTAIFSEPILT